MADLSPAAQAVLDAFRSSHTGQGCLAAALRAVANQVRMEEAFGETDADAGVFAAHHAIHTHLLAIADELEAQ